MRKGLATIPEKLAAFSPLFFQLPGFSLALCYQIGPISGMEQRLGSGGQENECPPSRGTEGSPEMLAQCYKMLASCYENQAGIGSSWVASSGPPQPWASEADMEAMEAGSLQETRTSPS